MASTGVNAKELRSWQEAFTYPLSTTRQIEKQLRDEVAADKERLRTLVGLVVSFSSSLSHCWSVNMAADPSSPVRAIVIFSALPIGSLTWMNLCRKLKGCWVMSASNVTWILSTKL